MSQLFNFPYNGKQFICDCININLVSTEIIKIGYKKLVLSIEKITIIDSNGIIEKKWTFIEMLGTDYIFYDEDDNQWIIGNTIISYTLLSTDNQLTFVIKNKL